MADVVQALIFDLLGWVAKGERSYEEVMDAWRTSCRKFPVWEDANDRGFILQKRVEGRTVVEITTAGVEFLRQRTREAGSEQQVPSRGLIRDAHVARRQKAPRSGSQR